MARTKQFLWTINTAVILAVTAYASGQQLNLCENFDLAYENSSSIELITPGYLKAYPPGSDCSCEISTFRPTSRPNSLNVSMVDLKLESCRQQSSAPDYVEITGTYSFQSKRETFRFCGTDLNQNSAMFPGPPGSGNFYGIGNKVTSLAYAIVTFHTDDIRNGLGAKLKVESTRGINIKCVGTSPPVPPAPPTIFPPAVTSSGSGGEGTGEPRNPNTGDRENASKKDEANIIAGSVVGVVVLLACVVAGVVAFVLIRRRKMQKLEVELQNLHNAEAAVNGGHNGTQSVPLCYADPAAGKPPLPTPKQHQNNVNDEYLYMNAGSPVYENPVLFRAPNTADDNTTELSSPTVDSPDSGVEDPKFSQYQNASVEALGPRTLLDKSAADKKPIPLPKFNLAKSGKQPSPLPQPRTKITFNLGEASSASVPLLSKLDSESAKTPNKVIKKMAQPNGKGQESPSVEMQEPQLLTASRFKGVNTSMPSLVAAELSPVVAAWSPSSAKPAVAAKPGQSPVPSPQITKPILKPPAVPPGKHVSPAFKPRMVLPELHPSASSGDRQTSIDSLEDAYEVVKVQTSP